MFKVDNAFLTKNKQVGIQFFDASVKDKHHHPRVATVYPNKKGQLVVDCSLEALRQQEYVWLIEKYNKLVRYYA